MYRTCVGYFYIVDKFQIKIYLSLILNINRIAQKITYVIYQRENIDIFNQSHHKYVGSAAENQKWNLFGIHELIYRIFYIINLFY